MGSRPCSQNKFELITGIESSLQSLRLLAADEGEVIAKLDDDERTLASYGVVGEPGSGWVKGRRRRAG